MYLAAVTSTTKVGLYDLDGWTNFNQMEAERTKKKPKKGITAAYMKSFFRRIKADARRALGDGPIYIFLDRAPAHRAEETNKLLHRLFDGVYLQSGNSPDMNMCDAGLFPWMERVVEERAASTDDEIRKAVRDCWDLLTPEMLKRVGERVRRNAREVRQLRGGNEYDE